MQYIVDLPKEDGAWKEVDTFDTKEDAIKFCRNLFRADEEGRVCLVSEISGVEDEEDDAPVG